MSGLKDIEAKDTRTWENNFFWKHNSISLRLVRDISVHEDHVPSVKYIRKMKNKKDEFAIGVYRNDFQKETFVGHMPRNISRSVYKFLKLRNLKLSCKVKGKRVNRGSGFVLEIPVIYKFNGHEKPSSG